MNGRIFSIEEFSTFDGPGIRMTVFLKGCPLRCSWCHNPEGQRFGVEYLRSPNGCLDCGACLRAGEAETGRPCLSEGSIAACPRNLVRCASWDTDARTLVRRIMKNAAILAMNGGGVTFSGGEPLAQPDFLLECLALLEGKVHRAVQTSAYAPEEHFLRMLSRADYVLCDLKLMDSGAHRQFCGTDNALILQNYRALAASGKPFVTRVPLIPGITDTEENLTKMAAFVAAQGVKAVELLPYNQLAGSKYKGLLRDYQPGLREDASAEDAEGLFARFGVQARRL